MDRHRECPRGRLAALVLTVGVLGGCAAAVSSSSSPPPPSPPTIHALGILASERITDPNRTYVLADGRTLDVSIGGARVLFEGAVGQPFVLGSDAAGAYVGVFARQDGLPADCHIAGIGAFGIERGAFVEIKGVLWHKAPSFHSDRALPATGQPYPTSTRFCFDDRAEVAYPVW